MKRSLLNDDQERYERIRTFDLPLTVCRQVLKLDQFVQKTCGFR